jgi:hypothetical protein
MRKRLVPHHGGIQRQMRCIVHGAKVLETAQGLEGDRAVIGAPGPASLRVRTSLEQPTVCVAPQLSDRGQLTADDRIKIFLLLPRSRPRHARSGSEASDADARAVAACKVDPALFRLDLRGRLAGWRPATASVKAHRRVTSTTASVETSNRVRHDGTAVDEGPRPNVCWPLFGMKDAS